VVEFAVLIPVLLTILFGVIEYGMWFTDSVGLRHGARETARNGVVQRWDGGGCQRGPLPGASPHLSDLACTAARVTPRTSGDLLVRIEVLDATGTPTSTWTVGGTLRICLMNQHHSLSGMVPLPRQGLITSQVDMAIERADPGQQEVGGWDAPPAGSDWSWCR
jgi:hypothetical protein